MTVFHADFLDEMKSVRTAWLPDLQTGFFQVGVREDGAFLVNASMEKFPGGRFGTMGYVKKDIPLDKKSDWIAVSGEGKPVALEADGSLWKWTFPQNPATNPASARKTRFSKYSDWIALAGDFNVVALAADGSIWYWQNENSFYRSSENAIPPLLAPSRKPQRLGNIFDAPQVP